MRKAEPFAERILALLSMEGSDFLGVIGHEALALAHEVMGNGEEAIKCRETQIEKMKEYIKATKGQDMYTYEDLGDRYDLLAALYMDRGGVKDFEIAIKYLKQSKKLAEKHGHKFDGGDLLEVANEWKSALSKK